MSEARSALTRFSPHLHMPRLWAIMITYYTTMLWHLCSMIQTRAFIDQSILSSCDTAVTPNVALMWFSEKVQINISQPDFKKKKKTPRRLFEKQVCMLPPVHDTFYSCARDKFHKEAMCMIRSIIFSLTQLYLLDSAIIRKNICQCGLTLFQMHKLIMYRTKFL